MSAAVRPFVPGVRRLLPPASDAARADAPAAAGAAASAIVRGAVALAATATGLGLVALLACGWFVRYTSHAFQMADLLHSDGFIGGQVAWYLGWTGRFGSNAVWLAALAPGPGFARVEPTVALLLWGGVLWVALPRVATLTGRRLDGVSRLLAVEVVLFATLGIAPALWFDLYKLTGAITYVTPLALGTAALAVGLGGLRRGRLGRRQVVALAMLSGFAIGFSDTYAGVQPILLACFALCAACLAGRRRAVAIQALFTASCASAVALAVLVAAPGNKVRRALYPPSPNPFTAIGRAIHDGWNFVAGPLAHSGLLLLVVAVAFAVLGMAAQPLRTEDTRPAAGLTLRRALLSVLILGAVVAGAHLPAEVMTSVPPPPRSGLIPTYAAVLAVAFLAWSAGVSLAARRGRAVRARRRPIALAAATAALAVAPALTMAMVASNWHSMAAYAAAKDHQWQQAAGAPRNSDAVVDPVTTTGIGPLSHDPLQEAQADPGFWVNQSMARYFGLHSLSAPRQDP